MLQLAAVFSDHMVLQREKNIVDVFLIGNKPIMITLLTSESELTNFILFY